MTIEQAQNQIIAIGQKLYQKGMIVAGEGNLSLRLEENRILATPSGKCKGELRPEDLVVIDREGKKIGGELNVSTEIKLHLEIYRQRRDVQAVIHAHPVYCLALMLAGYALDKPILAEQVVMLGKVPVAPYATPSTEAVPASIRPFITRTDFLMLDRHGAVTVGETLEEAFQKMELLEQTARSYYLALHLGKVAPLPVEEIKRLNALRTSRYRLKWRIIPFEEQA